MIGLRKRDPAAAVEAFGRLLKLQPDSPDVLNNQAMALFDIGRRDEALASLDRALALRPDYREALNNRAGLLDALAASTRRRPPMPGCGPWRPTSRRSSAA